MENISKWICSCGKEYVQPTGEAKFPIREVCECGKPLNRLMEEDGVITEFVGAPGWLVKDFDEHEAKFKEASKQCAMWQEQLFGALDQVMNARIKRTETKKVVDKVVNEGARRQGLLKRKDMEWNYNRMLNKWIGRPKPEKKEVK